MQKYMKWLVTCLITITFVYYLAAPVIVKAAKDIEIQYTDDVDNMPYPAMTEKYWLVADYKFNNKFVLPESGKVRIVARCNSSDLAGDIWISTDEKGFNIIGGIQKINQITSSSSGTYGIAGSEVIAYLEKGSYYVNYSVNKQVNEFQLGLLYETSNSEEIYLPSSRQNANLISIGEPIRGFLSEITPIDYYTFELTKKSLVDIGCNMKKNSNRLNLKLLDSRFQEVNNNSNGTDINRQLLNVGKYYVMLTGDYGSTDLIVQAEAFSLSLLPNTVAWTNKDVAISIKTIKDCLSLTWAYGNISMKDIDDPNIWGSAYEYDKNGNSIYIDKNIVGDKFNVNRNGTYTVRMRDKNNNALLKTIKIDNIDKVKPTLNVSNGKKYKKGYTISSIDKLSGIKKITLNGKTIKSTYKINKCGTYTVKAIDNAGNIKIVKFSISST